MPTSQALVIWMADLDLNFAKKKKSLKMRQEISLGINELSSALNKIIAVL